MALQGSVTGTVHAPAREVFELVTDVDRLPEWNAVITHVVEKPAAIERDAEWVVALRAMGNRWNSRSRVLEHDHGALRFVYRSQTDDGNPSFGIWTWTIDDSDEGATVTIGWELHPKTFVRRTLLAPMRNRQLRREVQASLQAVERCLHEDDRPA